MYDPPAPQIKREETGNNVHARPLAIYGKIGNHIIAIYDKNRKMQTGIAGWRQHLGRVRGEFFFISNIFLKQIPNLTQLLIYFQI